MLYLAKRCLLLIISNAALISVASSDAVAQERDVVEGIAELSALPSTATLRFHKGGANSLAYSGDGQRVVVGGRDGKVSIWDRKRGTLLKSYEPHDGEVTGVAFAEDGKRVVSCSKDKTVAVWQLEPAKLLHQLESHKDQVSCLTVDGDQVYAAGREGAILVWNLATGKRVATLSSDSSDGHAGAVTALVVLSKGQTIVAGMASGQLLVWTGLDARPQGIDAHADLIRDLSLSKDQGLMASCCENGRVALWDTRSWRQFRKFQAHSRFAAGAAFSPDDRLLATTGGHWNHKHEVGDADQGAGTVMIWEAPTGTPVLRLEGHDAAPLDLAFSPDGTQLASAGGDEACHVWDVSKMTKQVLPVEKEIAALTNAIEGGAVSGRALAAVHERRAAAHMRLEQWRKVVDDFRLAIRADPLNNMHLLRAGILAQLAEDPVAQRDSARDLTSLLAKNSNNMYLAERTVKVCTIGPVPIGEKAALVALAKLSVERSANLRWRAYFPSTEALMHYRFQDIAKARASIAESRRRNNAVGDRPILPELTNLLIESLCASSEGKIDLAKAAINRAKPKLQPFFDNPDSVGFNASHDWLTCQLLWIEARDAIFVLEAAAALEK